MPSLRKTLIQVQQLLIVFFFSVTCSCWYHNVNFIGFLYFVSIKQLVFIVAHLNSICFYWSHIEIVFAQDEGVSKNFPIINNRLPRAQ